LQPVRRVAWIWLGAALLLVFGAVFGAVRASAGKPSARYNHRIDQRLNVVVILSDDERWDGTTVMQNVRRLLVDHGVNFTNAHVTTSMCGPSRASILTGQYAHHTGVLDNFGPHAYPAFKTDEENDLPVWMHDAGYKTALVGKYINAYTGAAGNHEIPPGWDDWQVMDSIPMEAYYNYSINDNGHLEHYGSKPADYSTTVLTHKAVNFIHGARRPFFLYFAPVAPHLPAIPEKRDQGKLENIAPIHSPAFNQRNIGKEPWRFWHKDLLSAGAQIYINHVRIKQEEALLPEEQPAGAQHRPGSHHQRAGRSHARVARGRPQLRSAPPRRAGSLAARLPRGVPRQGHAARRRPSALCRPPDETQPLGRVQERLARALRPEDGPVGAGQHCRQRTHEAAAGGPERGPDAAL
jgi:N-acetylglucosamine-6-sulfatase